jgi:hypothetical protein
MKQNIMKKWVKALRSGKYKQGESYLKATWTKQGTKHCCLGVLCELYNDTMKQNKKKCIKETVNKDTVVHKFGQSDTLLPNAVKKWAGLRTNDGEFKIEKDVWTSSLTDMNDFGDTFKKIATFIENHYEQL